MSPSSSSSSSTSTTKGSSSSTPSTDRTKFDQRRDLSSGGESRTPLGWLFKKRMREHANEKGSASSNSVDIAIESPVRPPGLYQPFDRLIETTPQSESNHSMDNATFPPEKLPQPALLSPDYRPAPLSPEPPATTKRRDRDREPSTSTPKPGQNLPPLAEFTNLISPGQPGGLPPGFVPNPQLSDQPQQGGGQSPRRSASRSRRKDTAPGYEAAPLTPGVRYPTPPPGGADIPRPKSRASRSSRQGQVPGALGTP